MAGSQQGWRNASGGGSGGGVQSVTGLNTDNADPLNPIVKISVDGTTITGAGTPASPLVASGVVTGVQSVTGLNTDNSDPLNPIVDISTDGTSITGAGTPASPLQSNDVKSVTGLNTDNTDPLNPIIQISVDGVTITGTGTPASPLVATGGGVLSVTASSPVASSGGANPNISIPQSNGTTDGYLSSTDWTTFNSKLSSAFNQQIQDEGSNVTQRNIINFVGTGVAVTDTGSVTQVSINSGVTGVTASSPVASSGGATPNISMPQANGTTDGYLSSGDWTTFNTKTSKVVFTSQSLSTSPLTLTHNLNTRAVQVGIYDSATFENYEAQIVATTLNTITITTNQSVTADINIIG
jgi:hypothetical protein